GRPLAKIAARCMVGQTLAQQGVTGEIVPPYFSVKEAVFPFIKFPGVDTILGPEMKSTGEVMGVGESFAEAFLKSQLAAGVRLPDRGDRHAGPARARSVFDAGAAPTAETARGAAAGRAHARDMKRYPMTTAGAERLRAELQRLKTVERPTIVRAIGEARLHGDISENAEYHAAKERQGFIEARIRDIESKLADAHVVNPADIDAGGKIVFGATVDL